MPFEIIRADITKLSVDAIVNAANASLLGGGGVDGAIHRAAGPALLAECRTLNGCLTGEAKITKGYQLPAKYVIHTVGPIWEGGEKGEAKLLKSCYVQSLNLAVAHKLESIAFPLISSGAYGYPKDQALQMAITVISDFLMHNDMMIYLVVYDQKAFVLSEKLFASVQAFIDLHYVEEHALFNQRRFEKIRSCVTESQHEYKPSRSLDDVMQELQETFSEHLLRLIDLKGKTDVETYKRANIDRRLFSKIRSDKYYKPSKNTVLSLAIALELNLDETKDILQKAGYALSRSSRFDVIIEYFINEGNYDIFEINETLFAFEKTTLGV
ncbi:MAG: O-acetyl-ADP-ribose deacetylase [Tissierellales bacterium]|nr:O-acetyl-ADP-ribose deacetylase [Tissierellales bacterium]MBN2826925.1 O-acetyl-ADP-ribose deacetylase [Tissierellales bacterium]